MRPNNSKFKWVLGIMAALAGAFLFSLMALFVQKARNTFSAGELIFVRAISGILILSFFNGRRLKILFTKSAVFVWLRALFGSLSIACYYWNLQHSSLGTATVLTDLAPVFIVLFSVLFLNEKMNWKSILGVVTAVFGIGLLSSPKISDLSFNTLFVGLGSACFGAFAYLSLKQATKKYSSALIVWALSVTLAAITLTYIPNYESLMSKNSLWLLSGVVIASILAQIFLTISYSLLSTVLASILSLTAPLWAVLFDIVLLKRPWHIGELIAFTLLLCGVVFVQESRDKSSG